MSYAFIIIKIIKSANLVKVYKQYFLNFLQLLTWYAQSLKKEIHGTLLLLIFIIMTHYGKMLLPRKAGVIKFDYGLCHWGGDQKICLLSQLNRK